jgi:hypothetical protein
MENLNNPRTEVEQKVCDFIHFSMELRALIKHENRILLKSGEYNNPDLSYKKLEMLKRFSVEAPFIMEISGKGKDITEYLNKMLVDVLKDVRYHLNVNTNFQLTSMKRCLQRIDRLDNLKGVISDHIDHEVEGRESCH